MRKLPDIQPPEVETIIPQPLKHIEQSRNYRLITPLYGGGVTPGEVDLLTPIRGTEIRGHLRFWWRATRGGLFGEKMKEKEDEIWGKAYEKEKEDAPKNKSAKDENGDHTLKQTVQIEVLVDHVGESRKPFDVKWNRNGNLVLVPVGVPDYAVFPLRPPNDDLRQKKPQQIEEEMKRVQHNVQFTLKITFPPAYEDDVRAALWAWETFGGIGARTRRGFGALQLLGIDGKKNDELPSSNRREDVKSWLSDNLSAYVATGRWLEDVPHLEQSLSFEIVFPRTKVLDSWNELMKRYASFRQSRVKGSTGRSNWPEAEAIRDITKRRYYKELHHPQKFPRAAFGLPILFHFKDEKLGDPKDTTLQGANKENERLASSLILRPLVCNNGSAVGLAAILKGSRIPPLILKEVGESVQAHLSREDLEKLPELNDHQLNNKIDVLQAFLNNLRGNR
jgi:CRISPR-associated protein Cmr1